MADGWWHKYKAPDYDMEGEPGYSVNVPTPPERPKGGEWWHKYQAPAHTVAASHAGGASHAVAASQPQSSQRGGEWWHKYKAPSPQQSSSASQMGMQTYSGAPGQDAGGTNRALTQFAGEGAQELAQVPRDIDRGITETAEDVGQGYVSGAEGHVGPAQVLYGAYGVGKGLLGSPAGQAAADIGMSGAPLEFPAGRIDHGAARAADAGRDMDLRVGEGRPEVPGDQARGRVEPQEIRPHVSREVAAPPKPLAYVQSQAAATGKPAEGGAASAELPKPAGNRSTAARVKGAEYREARDAGIRKIDQAFKEAGLPSPGPKHNVTMAVASRLLREGKTDEPWDAWEMAERETAAEQEHLQASGALEPGALGAAASDPATPPAAGIARTADVVAQEHRHYVLNNKIDVLKTEARKIDDQYRKQATPEEWAQIHAYAEGDPSAALPPHLQQLHDTAILPLRQRAHELWREIQSGGKAAGIDSAELEEFDPTYMHREMAGKLNEDPAGKADFRRLGHGGDASGIGGATEYRTGRRGVYQASELKPRKYYAIENSNGERHLVHIDNGKPYIINKKNALPWKLPASQSAKEEFKPGSKIDFAGDEWTVKHALTREIEDKTENRYVKDALHSATNSVVRLEKTAEAIALVKNTKADLLQRGMATTSREVARVVGFKEPKFPGMGGTYIDQRLAKAMDNFAPREHGEDLMDYLLRLDRKLNNTLFWNPLVHGINVLIHAFEERGLRNLSPNPLSQYRATRDFFRGWDDTITQSKLYQDAQKAGAGLMYSPVRNRSWLAKHEKEIMANFDKQIGNPSSKYFAVRALNSISGASPVELIKSIVRSANESTWKINDAFVMRGIREHMRNGKSLEKAIEEVHSEIPNYRVSSEIVFGNLGHGKPAQVASSVLTNKYTRLYADYARFHFNVVSNLSRHAASTIKGIAALPKGAAGAKDRAAAIDAAGKLISLAGAYWLLVTQGDKLAQSVSGDPRSQMRAPGPLAVLRMVDDQINNRSPGQLGNLRDYTLGMFSPSPIVEMALAAAGRDYRGEAIVGKGDNGKPIFYQYKGGASAVPMKDRLMVMAQQGIAPIGQADRYMRLGPAGSALDIAWGTRLLPRTPEEKKTAAVAAKKSSHHSKPRVRHEDAAYP